jgi:phosphoglycolate phosphatase-like HAD superfamily hydrolase
MRSLQCPEGREGSFALPGAEARSGAPAPLERLRAADPPSGGRLTGAVLDVDGALVDSNEAHAQSWADALRGRGVSVPLERIRPLVGLPAERLLPRLTGIPLASPLGRRVDDARALLFRLDHLPGLRPFPRVRALLERMRAHGLRLAAVSAAGRADLERMLEIAGAADLLDARVAAEDLPFGGPEAVEAAIVALDVARDTAVMIADSPHDLAAAARAGMAAIALRCGGDWDDQVLSAALVIYQDPAELLERFDSSPLAGGPATLGRERL